MRSMTQVSPAMWSPPTAKSPPAPSTVFRFVVAGSAGEAANAAAAAAAAADPQFVAVAPDQRVAPGAAQERVVRTLR